MYFVSGTQRVNFTLFQHNNYEHGMDINVTEVWSHNVTGRGVTVAVVDDGNNIMSHHMRYWYLLQSDL